MANRLQIYRNLTTNTPPAELKGGELAYTSDGNTLYVGEVTQVDSEDTGNVLVLSDGDTIINDQLKLNESNGAPIVTISAPNSLTNSVDLKFPPTIQTDNKILAGTATGQLTFKTSSVESLSDTSDLETGTPTEDDFLMYDSTGDGEWKHITADEFKTKLGLGVGGSNIFNSMIVNGNLIVGGATEFDTADFIIKDKTLVLGVSGGVLEGTVTSATAGGTLVIEGTDGVNGAEVGHKLWVDGNTITPGIYTVSEKNNNTLTFSDYPSDGLGDDGTSSNLVLFSADAVSNTTIDESGFKLKGDTEKIFHWKKESGSVNPYFELTEGNLEVIGGESLYMEGIKVIDTESNTLHPDIAVDAASVEVELDGGVY